MAVYSVGLYKTSTEIRTNMNRREFLRTAGGAAGGTAALGAGANTAMAAEDGGGGGSSGPPDFGGYLDGANNYNGNVVDATGQDEVTVDVGAGQGLAFGPAAVHVDNGATVVWEWTGQGGAHNVVAEDGTFDSGSPVSSGTFEYTFESDGIYNYFCSPHKGSGMLGSIVVGTDFPTQSASGSTPLDVQHMGADIREHYVGVAVILATSVSLVFTFFLLKYGESSHTAGGNN
jgi:halocyanin-like protein